MPQETTISARAAFQFRNAGNQSYKFLCLRCSEPLEPGYEGNRIVFAHTKPHPCTEPAEAAAFVE